MTRKTSSLFRVAGKVPRRDGQYKQYKQCATAVCRSKMDNVTSAGESMTTQCLKRGSSDVTLSLIP